MQSIILMQRDRYLRYINAKSFSISLKTLTTYKKDPVKVIEFRTPNGTSDYRLWLNYITFFSSFLNCVKTKCFDKELIDYKFENLTGLLQKDLFSIDEGNANELADMIFKDQVDKDNFKEQYFSQDRRLI